ncbi:hypothetical protein DICPUDRAFT_153493 [Dictyostelium purpureum]|uniref:Uncharacterized protein n=1 Tax=Dictyostelium purpureum TaxID=5786 RepID=F0ZP21_DICPU|nr:uncharacterized protein DICPUDRAFT_153493 [Dictyostelium purpureum]EGC34283.1 hypothetical protein DICPUDRAFT_153493 [Dictyostelium purpureum]|eukprot:XP_003289165.1 hypothetical protein DICPUDRAFT_153493 [Dictyostelium purpureum]
MDEAMQPNLPVYLQKYILNLLCTHIHYYSKSIDPLTVGYTYRDKENEIKSYMINVGLVSKLFFKIISGTHVCIDLNHLNLDSFNKYKIKKINNNNNNSSKIIKIENIEVLKLHYDQTMKSFYRKTFKHGRVLDISIPIETINEQIKQMKSLKKIVLRNVNTIKHTLKFLDELVIPPELNIEQIKVLEFRISQKTTKAIVENLYFKVKKLHTIVLEEYEEEELLFQIFKYWFHSIKQFFKISDCSFPIIKFSGNILSGEEIIENRNPSGIERGNSINYLQNIVYYHFQDSGISLKELYCILKASPNLQFLSIQICLERLDYLFSGQIDRDRLKCKCRSIFYDNDQATIEVYMDERGISANQEDVIQEYHRNTVEEALHFWKLIKKLDNFSKLKMVGISHSCTLMFLF